MSLPLLVADPIEDPDRPREERGGRRIARQAGPMEPELRYRVLLATLKLETDFLELADRKARFALVIMSVLNAVALVAVMRSAALGAPGAAGLAMKGLLLVYGVATIVYIRQAIEALRPRGAQERPSDAAPTSVAPDISMRVLFHTDIAARDRDAYRTLWSSLRLDNVTAELADQVHMVSRINVCKFRALGRLYRGVGLMTALLTIILLIEGLERVVR